MSHLSTIIARFKNRLQIVYNNDSERASKDSLWIQTLRNLREYQEAWHDASESEITEANIIYSLYRNYLPNKDNLDIKPNKYGLQ